MPIIPHFSSECLEDLKITENLEWPVANKKFLVDDEIEIVVQINGKLRATLQMPTGTKEIDVLNAALAENTVQSHLQGNSIRKQIFIPDRLINLVVG